LCRVLREEWEKREELELLQEEQRILLEQEREKRREFETRQREKENQLLGMASYSTFISVISCFLSAGVLGWFMNTTIVLLSSGRKFYHAVLSLHQHYW
jgi:hypothetical protein